MRNTNSRASLRRARTGLLALCGLAGTLMATSARAASYYESNRSYFFSMGDARFAGGSVDVPTGAFLLRQPIARVPGRVGHTLSWFFNSQDGSLGPLGKGTSLSVSYFLQYINDGTYHFVGPGNRRFVLVADGNGNFVDARDPELLGAKFTKANPPNGHAGFLRFKEGSQYEFDYRGHLIRMLTPHGVSFYVWSNDLGFPTQILYGSSSQYFCFAYDGSNRLIRIDLRYGGFGPLDRSWHFAYDASSRLSTVTNPANGVTTYNWTSYTRSDGQVLPLVDTITNPRSIVALNNDYDSSGRLTQQTFANGGVLTASYSGAIGSNGTTTVTDPRGNVSQFGCGFPKL